MWKIVGTGLFLFILVGISVDYCRMTRRRIADSLSARLKFVVVCSADIKDYDGEYYKFRYADDDFYVMYNPSNVHDPVDLRTALWKELHIRMEEDEEGSN